MKKLGPQKSGNFLLETHCIKRRIVLSRQIKVLNMVCICVSAPVLLQYCKIDIVAKLCNQHWQNILQIHHTYGQIQADSNHSRKYQKSNVFPTTIQYQNPDVGPTL